MIERFIISLYIGLLFGPPGHKYRTFRAFWKVMKPCYIDRIAKSIEEIDLQERKSND